MFLSAGIYEIFCRETFGVKARSLEFGLQPYRVPETQTVRSGASWTHREVVLTVPSPPLPPSSQVCYLMPSSSPRCAQFPRAQDKVHFYIKLKELRDQMKGAACGSDVQETRYSFDLRLAKGRARRGSRNL